jgi:hypothetical protein
LTLRIWLQVAESALREAAEMDVSEARGTCSNIQHLDELMVPHDSQTERRLLVDSGRRRVGRIGSRDTAHRPRAQVRNRSAYLMGVLRRKVDQSDSLGGGGGGGKGGKGGGKGGGRGGKGGGKGGKGGGKGGGGKGGRGGGKGGRGGQQSWGGSRKTWD